MGSATWIPIYRSCDKFTQGKFTCNIKVRALMFSISISCPPNHKHLARSFSICQTTNAETDIIKPKVWEGGKKKLTTVLVFDSVVDQYYKPNRTLLINSRDVESEFLAAKRRGIVLF